MSDISHNQKHIDFAGEKCPAPSETVKVLGSCSSVTGGSVKHQQLYWLCATTSWRRGCWAKRQSFWCNGWSIPNPHLWSWTLGSDLRKGCGHKVSEWVAGKVLLGERGRSACWHHDPTSDKQKKMDGQSSWVALNSGCWLQNSVGGTFACEEVSP